MKLTNPLNLNLIDATGYTTGGNWDFYDQAHIDEIADSMRTNGWQGAPSLYSRTTPCPTAEPTASAPPKPPSSTKCRP